MANKKFSELTEVTSPNSESIFATAYDGDNFKVTLTNIAANMPSITTSGTVTATTFVGNVTGNITGSVTGNADTATALATGRTIGMTGDVTWTSASFDGTGNVTGTASIGSGVIVDADINASAAIDASKIHDGTVSNTEFGYLNGVTSAIQTQMDTKITASSTDTLTNKTINTASNTITITESDISDLGSYITASSTDTLTNKSGNISQWTNDSGYLTSFTETNDLSSAVTWANVPDANITQSSVTQHQAALSITESQISDLGSYITASSTDTLTNKTINSASNTITITESNISDLGSYITASSTDTLTNKSGSNSQWTNDAGYITASSTDTLTNKSGNISQWTNDSAYLTGNQTITLSGDASGSGTTAITVTVADDSHNHIISNVDGLQTALDGKVPQTSTTGSAEIPAGTTLERDGTPSAGYLRFNTTDSSFEGYDGSAWGAIGGGGGASAGGAIYENSDDITSNYTITSGKNGFSVGPMTIASGVTVTVPSGQRWVIL